MTTNRPGYRRRRDGYKAVNSERHDTPLLLVDQLVAWALYRSGSWVSTIGFQLRRHPQEVRRILYGPDA
jgi:hypothetical protein